MRTNLYIKQLTIAITVLFLIFSFTLLAEPVGNGNPNKSRSDVASPTTKETFVSNNEARDASNYTNNRNEDYNPREEYKKRENYNPREEYNRNNDSYNPREEYNRNKSDYNPREEYNNEQNPRNNDITREEYFKNKNTENYFRIEGNHSLWDGKHWEKSDFPLKVYVKDSNSRYYKDLYGQYIDYALEVWNDADERIVFEKVNNEYEAQIVFEFMDNLRDKYHEDYLGLCDYEMGDNSIIESTYIEIGLLKFDDQKISDGEIKNTIIHELGHALGLGHSDNSLDLMYPYISSDSYPEMDNKELSTGDRLAVQSATDLCEEHSYHYSHK